MERLTKRRADSGEPYMCTIEGVNNAVARLAAYEDTELEPEEITVQLEILRRYFEAADGIGLKRLRELSQAEKDGRLVVLPCKVGDTVYVIGTRRVIECCIDEAYLDDKNGIEYLVSFECDSDCDGCPFDSWRQDYSGEYSCDGEYGEGKIMGVNFWKTVFLTRQEAEEALRDGGANHEPSR